MDNYSIVLDKKNFVSDSRVEIDGIDKYIGKSEFSDFNETTNR